MIPKAYITEWSNFVPWQSNEQVEQDLVICRALVEIFSDDYLREHLAFRGGRFKNFINPSINNAGGKIPRELYSGETIT